MIILVYENLIIGYMILLNGLKSAPKKGRLKPWFHLSDGLDDRL